MICRACSCDLPASSFYANGDRLFTTCKRCVCARQKAKRVPETPDARHRLARRLKPTRTQRRRKRWDGGLPFLLGVWPLAGAAVCMGRCGARATVALLVKPLGEDASALRLCDEHYQRAIGRWPRN